MPGSDRKNGRVRKEKNLKGKGFKGPRGHGYEEVFRDYKEFQVLAKVFIVKGLHE
jgi:hypothetical protein